MSLWLKKWFEIKFEYCFVHRLPLRIARRGSEKAENSINCGHLLPLAHRPRASIWSWLSFTLSALVVVTMFSGQISCKHQWDRISINLVYKTVLAYFIHTTTHIDKLDMGIELPGEGDVGLLDTSDLLLVWPLFEASVIGSHCKMLRRLANWGRQHSCVT